MQTGITIPSISIEFLESIREAYRQGYFAMGSEGTSKVEWYRSTRRALLPIEGMHQSRSFARFLRNHPYCVTFDQDFAGVMRGCMRPGENWIVPPIIEWFHGMHAQGWAHSCEVWRAGDLVGGVYGLAIGSCFVAESMFHRETNCSKLALHSLIEHCRGLGFTLFDAQIMNPHLASLGAYEIPHSEFMAQLVRARDVKIAWE